MILSSIQVLVFQRIVNKILTLFSFSKNAPRASYSNFGGCFKKINDISNYRRKRRESLNGTTAMHSFLISRNASIFRVHDVNEMKEVKSYRKASFK